MIKNRDQRFIPLLIVVFGMLLSGLFGWFFYKQEEKSIIVEFRNDVDNRAASLYREVLMNFEALRSLAILFNRPSIPGQELFKSEAARILSRHNDIQALEWIPHVPQLERARYESGLSPCSRAATRGRRDLPCHHKRGSEHHCQLQRGVPSPVQARYFEAGGKGNTGRDVYLAGGRRLRHPGRYCAHP